jgi:hypothetical protein
VTPEEFAARRRALSDHVTRALVLLFTGLASWRDYDQARFVEQAVPVIRGGQSALASLTAAWVAQQASTALDRRIAPPVVPDSAAVNLRNGIDDTTVYTRPFATVYTELSQGSDLPAAVERGSVRLAEIAEMDLQQTYSSASRAAMQDLPAGARPRFWRRVLIGPENCAMCVLASTQRYRVENLKPIHPGCDCEQAAIYGDDPGQIIDETLLDKVHQAVEDLIGVKDFGGRAPDYRHLVTQITAEHGELGSLLVRPGDRFTGPGDVAS